MKLHNISFFLMNKIIQYSPPRTGSSLMYNILKLVFKNSKIKKMHNYKNRFSYYPVIVTYRNPLDAIASMYQVKELEPNLENIDSLIKEFDLSTPNKLIEIENNTNVLLLKYELFLNDFDYIFDELEKFFSIKIDQEKRLFIKNELNIDSVNKKIETLENFEEFDKETHWHGNHISKFKGESGYFNKFFNEEIQKKLKNHYKDFLTHFGY